MISAKISENKLIIDLSWMNQKYKEKWKKITFTLFYGVETKFNSWLEEYKVEFKKEIIYSWEKKVFFKLNEVKYWYIWKKIFIWYYLEVNFWKKFLIFKDKKNIDVIYNDKRVFNYKKLKKNKYNFKDTYSYKEIIKNMTLLRKSFLIIFVIIFFVWFYLYKQTWDDKYFVLMWYSFVLFLVTFFAAWKSYFSWKIKKDIKEWYFLKDIITWKIKKNLEELKIKLFAYNSEKWKYEDNNGSSTRIVNFNTKIWGILLYEKKFVNLKAWDKIENFLDWKLDCEKIYKNLFPTIAILDDMWLFLNLELIIISKKYKDIILKREINLEKEKFLEFHKEKKAKNNNIDNNLNSDFFE
jgi:hypothetical protein